MEPFILLVTPRSTPTSRTVCGAFEFLLDTGSTSISPCWAPSQYTTTLPSGRCYLFSYFLSFFFSISTLLVNWLLIPATCCFLSILFCFIEIYFTEKWSFFFSFEWIAILYVPHIQKNISHVHTHTHTHTHTHILSFTQDVMLLNIFSALATNWLNSCKGYYDYRHLPLNIKSPWHDFFLVMFYPSRFMSLGSSWYL